MSETLELEAEAIESSVSCGPDHQWLTRGHDLAARDDATQKAIAASQFAIGDWLAEGEDKWSRAAYKDAQEIFPNHTLETLRNFVCVARAVKTSLRNDDLSWSHHAAVTRFKQKPETQKELLAKAASDKMPLTKFRSHIAKTHPTEKTERPLRLTLKPAADIGEELLELARALGDEPEAAVLRLVEWALRQPNITESLRAAT